jgi:hypothetical protein
MRNVRTESFLFRVVACLGAAGLLFNALACSSDTRQVEAPPPSPEANTARAAGASLQAPTLATFKSELGDSKAQIDGALATLNKLTDPRTPASELRGTYDTYADQLARITQHAQQMKQEAERMRDSRAAYFAKWEEKAAEIDNPSIRASAEARKNRLRASHDRITTASLAARDAYEPFMRDLQDVRKFLATELSPATTSMLGDVSKKANADGATVKQKIDAVITELDTVTGTGAQ